MGRFYFQRITFHLNTVTFQGLFCTLHTTVTHKTLPGKRGSCAGCIWTHSELWVDLASPSCNFARDRAKPTDRLHNTEHPNSRPPRDMCLKHIKQVQRPENNALASRVQCQQSVPGNHRTGVVHHFLHRFKEDEPKG